MATDFPMQTAYNIEKGLTAEEFTPSQTVNENLLVGDLGIQGASPGTIKRSGADPAAGTILGFSPVNSELARVLTPNGKIPIYRITSDAVFCLSSATTPVEATHLNQEYGITRSSAGNWRVDVAKTTTDARVKVVRLNVAEGKWFCIFLAEFIDDGVDS